MSLLIKAAPILTEEMYGDIQPAAWELLLSVDEHMAGAAGKRTEPLHVATLGARLAVGHRPRKAALWCPNAAEGFLGAVWFSQTFMRFFAFCG